MLQRRQEFSDRTAAGISIGGFVVPLVFVAYLAIVRGQVAAVLSPVTFAPSFMITPAPRKPMPDTT
jgi:hypothetical protein